jgi:hypothetical protein
VTHTDGISFARSYLSAIDIESADAHFCVREHFILDIEGVSRVRYIGSDPETQIADGIEIVGESAFVFQSYIRSLSFASNLRLHFIESNAFCPLSCSARLKNTGRTRPIRPSLHSRLRSRVLLLGRQLALSECWDLDFWRNNIEWRFGLI